MTSSFATIVIPIPRDAADKVKKKVENLEREDLERVKALGGPANKTIRDRISGLEIVHFMSMTVLPATKDARSAFMIVELSVDGLVELAIRAVAAELRAEFEQVLAPAVPNVHRWGGLEGFLLSHSVTLGVGWGSGSGPLTLGTAVGLPFCGSPGFTVKRIEKEQDLADEIAKSPLLGRPMPALEKLEKLRAELWNQGEWKWSFMPEPAPFLEQAPKATIAAAWPLARAAIASLLWPLMLVAAVISAVLAGLGHWYTWIAEFLLIWLGSFLLLLGIVLACGAMRLRRAETRDKMDDTAPTPAHVSAIMTGENHQALNHLVAVAKLKPGMLRPVTLRLALFLIGQLLGVFCTPGFLGRINVVHFARWILLPGTDQLVFLTNYDGAWESYLEDFVQRSPQGASGIWSNCDGFPRTSWLFGEGTKDGDRFRRWVRRQQIPTQFWYAAYPDLTLARMRINAQIRRGFAEARTETQAQEWLAQFGARTPVEA